MSDQGRLKFSRPLGVSLLAALYFLGSVFLLGIAVLGAGSMASATEELGVSGLQLAIGIGFLGALGIAAGVGMWMGKRWGWWLGAFYLFYSIARNANALLTLPALVEQIGPPEGGVAKYQFRYGGRIVFAALFLLYFFKANVVAWFGVDTMPAWKRVALLTGATIGIAALFAALALLAGGET